MRRRVLFATRSPVVLATAGVAATGIIAAVVLALTDRDVWAVLVLGVALLGITVCTTAAQQYRAMQTAVSLRQVESTMTELSAVVEAGREVEQTERILTELRTRAQELTVVEERVRQQIRALDYGDQLAELSDRADQHAENAELRATKRQAAMSKLIKSTLSALERPDDLGAIQSRLDEIAEMSRVDPMMQSRPHLAGPTATARDIELVLAHLLATPQRDAE